jgi:hypothetical protein
MPTAPWFSKRKLTKFSYCDVLAESQALPVERFVALRAAGTVLQLHNGFSITLWPEQERGGGWRKFGW